MTKLAVLLALAAATVGCSKKGNDEAKAKYSALCVEADKQMTESSASGK